jgi:hypothetical protein
MGALLRAPIEARWLLLFMADWRGPGFTAGREIVDRRARHGCAQVRLVPLVRMAGHWPRFAMHTAASILGRLTLAQEAHRKELYAPYSESAERAVGFDLQEITVASLF